MLSVAKIGLLAVLSLLASTAWARDIYLLTVGDQSAANCHVHSYGAVQGVYQLGVDGIEREAADPLDWSDCKAGSIWMPLATRLKRQPGVHKVVLMSVGVNAGKAADFVQGTAAQRLNQALQVAREKHVHFDYALWQQGLPDVMTPGGFYMNQVRKTLKSASIKNSIDKWIIGSLGCKNLPLNQIVDAQSQLGEQVVLNRFAGPINVQVDSVAQQQDCVLTAYGQDVMAQQWFKAIMRADHLDKKYEQEALISWFK